MKFNEIPLLPLSAIIFYFLVLIFISTGLLPQTNELINMLERLYESYGLIGLFVAAFFEGLVYIGLYFAGSFIILFIVLFSNGSFISLLTISIIVTIALTISCIVNYALGRYFVLKTNVKEKVDIEKRFFSKGLVLSSLHPNFLAFYFFNLGLKKKSLWKLFFVPIIMIPYGFLLAFLLYQIKPIITSNAENPYILITALIIWFIAALIIKNKK